MKLTALIVLLVKLLSGNAQHGPSPPAPFVNENPSGVGEALPPAPPPSDCSGVQCPNGTKCKMIEEPCNQLPCLEPLPECVRETPELPSPTVSIQQPHIMRSKSQSSVMTTTTTRSPSTFRKTTTHSTAAETASSSTKCAGVKCAEGKPMCINKAPPLLRCPKNESWSDCSTKCEPSCEIRIPKCDRQCGEPKCQCNPGFLRHHSGTCVSSGEC
ncbi:hypothetical protein RB195_015142 [Necator americanus]|uniref:TIL domain-containing protein n=1 Tax=Necator americanus TaxID=51031 RepID=A0ABR1E376_NECAM